MNMKKLAIVSDLHSNQEALTEVMADIDKEGCQDIVCLGDLIGYGPNPRQILKTALERFRFTLRGNHEEAVIKTPEGFNWKAAASSIWTKRQIISPAFPAKESERMWSYINGLPEYVEEGDALFVHASPNDPVWEYVMPEYAANRQLMKTIFARIRRIAFGGHTHLPGIFLDEGRFIPQGRVKDAYPVTRGKFFVNVGSVGQPRDQNPLACYAIYDGESIKFKRVRYDFRTTARKISKIKDLPLTLGTRLGLGV